MSPTEKLIAAYEEQVECGRDWTEIGLSWGFNAEFTSRIRNRKKQLSPRALLKFCQATGIPPDWMRNPRTSWPYRPTVIQGVELTEVELEVLKAARFISDDDPELKEARRRLYAVRLPAEGYTGPLDATLDQKDSHARKKKEG